jgi:hypothetical protein
MKRNSTIVTFPSSATRTMQLGSLAGMTALTIGIGQGRANKAAPVERNDHNNPPAPEGELQHS